MLTKFESAFGIDLIFGPGKMQFKLSCIILLHYVVINDHQIIMRLAMGFWVPGFYFHFLLILPGGVCSSLARSPRFFLTNQTFN